MNLCVTEFRLPALHLSRPKNRRRGEGRQPTLLECQETTLKKPVSDSFKSEISLKEKAKNEQSRWKESKNQHKCYSCGRGFESTKNLTWHILNCRSKELKSKSTKSNVEKTQKSGLKVNDFPPNQTSASGLYFCQYCQISLTQKQRLRVSLPDFI